MESLLVDHEFRSLIPPLAPEEFSMLEQSILDEGVRDAIVTWNGYIVDGHNRYDIITRHGIKDYRVIEKHFEDKEEAKNWIKKNQIGRRNIPKYLRGEYLLEIEEWEEARRQAKEKILKGLFVCPVCKEPFSQKVWHCPKCDHHWPMERTECLNCHDYVNNPCMNSHKGYDSKKELAEKLKISEQTASRIIQIKEKASEEDKEKLRKGEATINQVYTKVKREEIRNNNKEAEWPTGKYRIIYADPPWGYRNTNPVAFGEQEDHYNTYTPEEIIDKFPVNDIALDNSVLFLWVTSPILEQSFDVIRAWGFKYKASFVWDKVKHVMGHYNSVRHEFLLIAVRGSCQPDVMQLFDSVQTFERNGHSQKPDLFREIIDTIYPHGPRIELFATKKIDGWEVYGNQIPA